MGTDINGVVQERLVKAREGSPFRWRNLMEIEADRNYALFAALAGVRNYGNITPISEPRGLPEDFETINGDEVKLAYSGGKVWMGDHSYTWLTLEEMLDWDGWDQRMADGTLGEYCRTWRRWLDYLESKYSDGLYEVRVVIGFDS